MFNFLRFPFAAAKMLLAASFCLSGEDKVGTPAHAVLGSSTSLGPVLQRTVTFTAEHRAISDVLATIKVSARLESAVVTAARKVVTILAAIFATVAMVGAASAGAAFVVFRAPALVAALQAPCSWPGVTAQLCGRACL